MAEYKVPQLTLCLIVACFQLASTNDCDLTLRLDTLQAEHNIIKARYTVMETRYTAMEARYTAMEAMYRELSAKIGCSGSGPESTAPTRINTEPGAPYTTPGEEAVTLPGAPYTTTGEEAVTLRIHSQTRKPAPTTTPIHAGPLVNPIMDIDVTKLNPQLSDLRYVAAMPDGGAMVCNIVNGSIYQAVRLNTTGFADPTPIYTDPRTIDPYDPPAIIPIDDQEVIIVSWRGDIKRVSLKNHTVLASYQVAVVDLVDAILLEDSVLLYVDSFGGKIVTYSMSDNSSVVRISRLNSPTGIARYTNSTHTLYFVNEGNQHQINVYDFSWNLMNTIGGLGTKAGQLKYPFKSILSSEDTILVADYGNNRVEEFSLEGKFVRHIISGIKQPWMLSYHPLHPAYLWVGNYEGNSMTVSRFRIY